MQSHNAKNRYTFHTAEGKVCCSANELKYLCPRCQAWAGSTSAAHLKGAEGRNCFRTTGKPKVAPKRGAAEPPKPYDLALQKRQGKVPSDGVVKDADGLPLPYDTALERDRPAAGS